MRTRTTVRRSPNHLRITVIAPECVRGMNNPAILCYYRRSALTSAFSEEAIHKHLMNVFSLWQATRHTLLRRRAE
jgi:hypothetical protein